MSTEENKALARRLYEEVFNQGQLEAVDQLVAPDAIEHEEVPGIAGSGSEILKHFVTIFRAAFPDAQVTIEDLIAEGDKVVCRVTFHGTQQGEFMGIAPTGRPITFAVIDILRVADGKIVEHWGQTDNLGLLQQLGAIPAPGQPGA
jgi:steroid delta-isomerase-like uncharacterized protein